ncbi:MAG: cyclic nucleotide-binding domain-containing protein [Rickettsiales bacterium]|nr:cyclic nucleotide-binding domain-containing protein [Rickettsiales bacterium]
MHYKPGEIIFRQGYPGDNAYIIIRGQVEIIDEMGDGTEYRLALLEAGQMFGEMALLDDKPRSATARAATEVILQVMPI